jgi:hypothetical protein
VITGVAITNLAPGEIEIESAGPVQLAAAAQLERQADGGWTPLQHLDVDQGYRLVERCGGAAPPSCVDLAPGATLHPVPFQGFDCAAQCNASCRANVWLGPGTFRFVLRTCAGAVIPGPPFDLPGPDSSAALSRWGLAADAVSATAARLDKPAAGWNGTAPPAADRIAGFAVRPGSERPLAAADLGALLERLRAPDGYDDRIAKRCAMDHLVGFRLTRRPATTGAPRDEVAEVAIDFNCQKLFAVRGGERGRARALHGTHFDPSRAAFLALVKRVFPGDAELGKR